MKNKKNKPFAQKLIPIIILAVIAYTVAAFILQFVGQTEISPSLTVAYFAFWGTELISLATIKNAKSKHNYSSSTDIYDNETEFEEDEEFDIVNF